MKQSKRILSFLMAVVMMSSFVNIYAGAKAPYKDAAIPSSRYDDLDKPVLTLDQYSSMLLDYVDKILAKKNIILDLEVMGTLDLTSVDNILNGIYSIFNGAIFWLWPPTVLGDLRDIDKSGISTYRRASTPAAGADTNVIYSVIDFISDNRAIFSKIIDGTAYWGLLNPILNLSDVNLNQTIKKLLFEQAAPGTAVPETVTETADNLIQQIVSNLISAAGAPELAGTVDINGTAVAYGFMDKLLQDVYNLVLVPVMNSELKKAVRVFCGVAYVDPEYPNGDESNLNEYAAVFDIDFAVPAHTFAAGTTLVSDLNSILGEITAAVIPGYSGWTAGDNTLILNNLRSAAKYVLKNTDGKLFAEFAAVATDAEIDAMNNQELFSYIFRSVLNSAIGTMNIPANADTLLEAAWYALKEVLALKVPQNDYAPVPKTLDGILFMLADIAVYYINQTIDMNPAAGVLPGAGLLAYGQGFDATLTAVMAWVKNNYGGLLNLTLSGTDGWADLNTIVTAIMPSNWISGFTNVKTLFKTQVLQSILDLNTTTLFALFDHVAGNDLATKTIKKVLLERFAVIINLMFPSAVRLTYTSFETLISNMELKYTAEMLALQLYNRRIFIVPAVLPLVNKWIGVDSPQTFLNPVIVLPNQIGAATTFQIRNDSTGINTGATNKAGTFTQDSLYKIKIESLTSGIPAITPTNLIGTFINSGESVNCTLSGTFAANQVLMITMTYDVYTELGTKLTETPLTAMAFTYISGVVDDGKNAVTVNPLSDNYHAMKYFNTYLNWPSAPVEPVLPENPTPEQQTVFDTLHAQWVTDIAAYNTDKNASMASLADLSVQLVREPKTTLGSHATAATVSRGTATVNATLIAGGITAAPFTAIATTGDGGTWSIPYYSVDASPARPADGMYQSSFAFTATKTGTINPSETFSIPHKVVFYNDFGLPGLLASELNAKRDPADYSDSAAWDDYIFALKGAVAIQFRPRTASTFMSVQAPAFETVVQTLKETVSALEASALLEDPWAAVPQVIDAVNPPNPPGISYDDPDYNYFGLADYVPYTYLNYQREVANCRALLTTQQQLKQIDVAYALHRFYLYASRLIPVQATKARLNEAITAVGNPVQSQYTTTSWAAFAKALAFANTVNAQSETATDAGGNYVLRQTKVDTAREKLAEAFKQLAEFTDNTDLLQQLSNLITYAMSLKQSDYTPGSWAVFQDALTGAFSIFLMPVELRNSPGFQTMVIVAIAELQAGIDQLVLKQVDPNPHPFIIDGEYVYGFTGGCIILFYPPPGYQFILHPTPQGYGTGTLIEITFGGEPLGTFTLIIFGDINGDANIDAIDAGMLVDSENYLISLNRAQRFAGDVNRDGSVDSIDAGTVIDAENYLVVIDQNNGYVGGGIIPH